MHALESCAREFTEVPAGGRDYAAGPGLVAARGVTSAVADGGPDARAVLPRGETGIPRAQDPGRLSAVLGTVTGVSEQSRDMHSFELEPEVGDWLDSLSDSDFKRVDELCGMLAERGHRAGRALVRSPAGPGVGTMRPASPGGHPGNVLVQARRNGRVLDGVPQDPPARSADPWMPRFQQGRRRGASFAPAIHSCVCRR